MIHFSVKKLKKKKRFLVTSNNEVSVTQILMNNERYNFYNEWNYWRTLIDIFEFFYNNINSSILSYCIDEIYNLSCTLQFQKKHKAK